LTASHPGTAIRLDQPVDLGGRHVIVTGASRGIGAAIAGELARSGACVSLVARERDSLEAVRRKLAPAEQHAVFEADVTDPRAVQAMVTSAIAQSGPAFALVNNVGFGEAAAFREASESHWRRMIDVNLMSAVFCTRALLPSMQSRHEGRIVNIASTAALRGYRHVTAYTASKHALLGLTRALALEVAKDGVSVNAVCPGYTNTEMLAASIRSASARTGKNEAEIRARYEKDNAHGRLIEPEEVARIVAWLCGVGATDITGKYIAVDGRPLEVSA
jgi:NAD(P)-dependent dehydrogenase (short-subunit alcohol dehydrogenase family)